MRFPSVARIAGGIATEAQGQGGRGEGGLGWPVGTAIVGVQVKPIWAGGPLV